MTNMRYAVDLLNINHFNHNQQSTSIINNFNYNLNLNLLWPRKSSAVNITARTIGQRHNYEYDHNLALTEKKHINDHNNDHHSCPVITRQYVSKRPVLHKYKYENKYNDNNAHQAEWIEETGRIQIQI